MLALVLPPLPIEFAARVTKTELADIGCVTIAFTSIGLTNEHRYTLGPIPTAVLSWLPNAAVIFGIAAPLRSYAIVFCDKPTRWLIWSVLTQIHSSAAKCI